MFQWDEVNNIRNQTKHGLSFDLIEEFDWDNPLIIDRSRHQDGETRYAAIGMLNGKLHTVIFTQRSDDIRLISLRRANKQEEKAYAKQD